MKCELCETYPGFTKHHLIPQSLHSNKWFKKHFKREDLKQTILICVGCHRHIHQVFLGRNKELGRKFNTKEKLLSHPQMLSFVEWRKKQFRA